MKKFLLIAVAAASFAATLPASAQVVIREGREGVGVRIGEPRHEYRRDRVIVEHRRCRSVTERREGRHGRIVVTTRRVCG